MMLFAIFWRKMIILAALKHISSPLMSHLVLRDGIYRAGMAWGPSLKARVQSLACIELATAYSYPGFNFRYAFLAQQGLAKAQKDWDRSFELPEKSLSLLQIT